MTLRSARLIATALTLTLAPMAASADGVWEGSWDTNYPNLNLTQDGQLVYGEYEGRGWIVGLTDVSGSILRGAWVYDSGRWGALEFRMQPGGASFVGEWDEEVTSFPYGSGTAWTGTRLSSVPQYSADFNGQIEWPEQFDFSNQAVLAWLRNGQGSQLVVPVLPVPPAPVNPATARPLQCPDVAMNVGLSASNNPFVTVSGITDATTAPWTIYAQPPVAPLGSLSFGGDTLNLQLDACIPVFGMENTPQRHLISISNANLLRRGDGDYEGTGWFHDPTINVQGEISLYLTDPGAGQGLAALTLGNGGAWAESVLLDYSAD